MNAARGLGWLFWRRHRWSGAGVLCYAALIAFWAHSAEGSLQERAPLFFSSMPLMFALLLGMSAFAFPEADISGTRSGFPRQLFLLPVRSSELAFWPLAYGAVVVGLGWAALARLILIPAGLSVPLAWPAAMLAAMLACLQALVWSPVGVRYFRLVLAMLILPALPTLGVQAHLRHVPEGWICAFFALVVPVAHAAAAAGVRRARWGEEVEWKRPKLLLGRAGTASPHPFRSPRSAQLWLEWTQNGLMLPLLVVGLCALLSLPLLLVRDLAPAPEGVFGFPAPPGLQVNLWLKLQRAALLWPVVLAAILGCGVRKSETRRKDLSVPPFTATRPVSSAALVGAKLKMAALSALLAWAGLLFFLGLWLLTPARDGERGGPLALLLWPHLTPRSLVLLAGVLPVLLFWTWRNEVEGLFTDLTGRALVAYGYPLVLLAVLISALVFGARWLTNDMELTARVEQVRQAAPWVIWPAVTLKAVAAVAVVATLLRRRLVAPGTLACFAAAWLAFGSGLVLFLRWWIAGEPVVASPQLLSLPYCAAAVFLFLPIVRLALAPLALEWNRHR